MHQKVEVTAPEAVAEAVEVAPLAELVFVSTVAVMMAVTVAMVVMAVSVATELAEAVALLPFMLPELEAVLLSIAL